MKSPRLQVDRETQFKTVLESNQDRIYRICCCYIRDEAEARHRFMGPQACWLAGSGLMVLGVVSGVYFDDAFLRRYVDPEHQALGIALYGLGYLLVCAAGFTFTYRNWRRDKAPLLADIQQLKAELTADEADASSETDTS